MALTPPLASVWSSSTKRALDGKDSVGRGPEPQDPEATPLDLGGQFSLRLTQAPFPLLPQSSGQPSLPHLLLTSALSSERAPLGWPS